MKIEVKTVKNETQLMISNRKTVLLAEILIKKPTSNMQHLYETIKIQHQIAYLCTLNSVL
jgi:hypothetical protein